MRLAVGHHARPQDAARGIFHLALAVVALLGMTSQDCAAEDEIRIGNTMPYTGPASAYGLIGKVITAYFNKFNAEFSEHFACGNFIS